MSYCIHCPRCGKEVYPEEFAFDFGKLIKESLEKDKKLNLKSAEYWHELKSLNLNYYLTAEDLKKAIKSTDEGEIKSKITFNFTVDMLKDHFMKLIIKSLNMYAQDNEKEVQEDKWNLFEQLYKDNSVSDNLVNALANKLNGTGEGTTENLNDDLKTVINKTIEGDHKLITQFDIRVNYKEDDQENKFVNQLNITFRDDSITNEKNFVCKGSSDHPCGQKLFPFAGQCEEKIIGLAGTSRVGKTSYLASLVATLVERELLNEQDQDKKQVVVQVLKYADTGFEVFKEKLLKPYMEFDKVEKTDTQYDSAPLFSLVFAIKVNGKTKNYIFTFVDMPGEAYDAGEIVKILTKRPILTKIDALIFCIAPKQISPDDITDGEKGDKVELFLDKVFPNIVTIMDNIKQENNKKIPNAVLITCSDLIPGDYKKLYDNSFQTFGDNSNIINEEGYFIIDNAKPIMKESMNYLMKQVGLAITMQNVIGDYSPFAVASYGFDIKEREENLKEHIKDVPMFPKPSMVAVPFAWILAMLKIIPAYELDYKKVEEKSNILDFIKKPFSSKSKKKNETTKNEPILKLVEEENKLICYPYMYNKQK